MRSVPFRAGILSVIIFALFIGVWWLFTRGTGVTANIDPEYAKLMGATVTQGTSAFPTPAQVGSKLWQHLTEPFYDRGPNDKGIGIQLAFSLARVLIGYF